MKDFIDVGDIVRVAMSEHYCLPFQDYQFFEAKVLRLPCEGDEMWYMETINVHDPELTFSLNTRASCFVGMTKLITESVTNDTGDDW